jgi:hypothetical protein
MHRSPMRQKHAQSTLPPSMASVQHDYRNRIETVGRLRESMLPNTLHAVTAEGFALKVFRMGLAYSINGL